MANQEQTTLDIDQMMRESMSVFSGHPAEDGDAGATSESGPAVDGNAATKSGAENLENASVSETDTGKSETKEKTSPENKHRFKTHDDAETGYKNLQGEKTRLEQRIKSLESENAEFKKSATAGQIQTDLAKADEEIEQFEIAKNKEALAAINKLDPDDPDHEGKVAAIWAKANREVRKFENQKLGSIETRVAAAENTTAEAKTREEEIEAVRTHIREVISSEEHGLEQDDPVFWYFASRAPAQDEQGEKMSLDEQIGWALENTKNHYAKIRGTIHKEQEVAAAARGREHQEKNLPLSRSAATRSASKAEDARPVSLDDALKEVRESRRI
jgi:hypothetical protein